MQGYQIALIVLGAILLLAAVLVVRGIWENRSPQLTRCEVRCKGLPAAFEGFTVAHISDLHNARFGKDQARLLALIGHPDLIAVTGDLIDKRRPGMAHALSFAAGAAAVAPVYYAAGNHEAKSKEYPALCGELARRGVHILFDEAVPFVRGGAQITLAGLADARFVSQRREQFPALTQKKLARMLKERDGFCLLLAHRPELFSVYAAAGADLSLCGHAHGGQFRIPLLGGLIAPDQGLFPKYCAGIYRDGAAQMVVSRGLGNSSVPIRLNNRPEVVLITLRRAAEE